MIAILWTYDVRPEAVAEFERIYGPAGDWATLFRRGEGHAGTALLRGPGHTYLTIDRWHSRADFDAFLSVHRGDYEALDRATEGLTLAEQALGSWDEVTEP